MLCKVLLQECSAVMSRMIRCGSLSWKNEMPSAALGGLVTNVGTAKHYSSWTTGWLMYKHIPHDNTSMGSSFA